MTTYKYKGTSGNFYTPGHTYNLHVEAVRVWFFSRVKIGVWNNGYPAGLRTYRNLTKFYEEWESNDRKER